MFSNDHWIGKLYDQQGRPRDRAARDEHLLSEPSGGVRHIYNGSIDPFGFQGRFFPKPEPGYLLMAIRTPSAVPEWPGVAVRHASEWLPRFAEIMGAYWGCAFGTPERVCVEQQSFPDRRYPHPDFLPRIREPDDMPDPFTPPYFGWINWWSREACARVGFSRECSALPFVRDLRPTPGGGFQFRLTEEPLDLRTNEEHRRALAEAYERFPAVGRRR